MRTRTFAALVLLLLPAMMEAQGRITPRIGTRVGPPRNEPLPPQPPLIARAMVYYRLPYSVESYPMVAHFDAMGYLVPGATYSWTSGGAGSLAQYRITRNIALALNMTSSFVGGPAVTSTAEVGTRLGRSRGEHRLSPFVDLRVGYLAMYETGYRPYDFVDATNPSRPTGNGNYSDGVGAIGGAGLEYGLTHTLSLVSAASLIRADIRRHELYATTSTTPRSYRLTSYRYMVALRWNPVRYFSTLTQQDLPTAARP